MRVLKVWFLVIIVLTALARAGTAAVPPMISYQGKLMQPSGAPVADGTVSIQFAIYDVPTGGTALWSETNSGVQVKGGLFSVLLGSVVNLPSSIFDGSERFFGMKVGSDPEVTPRQQVASAAFAYKSAVAGTVEDGAITASKLAPGVAMPPGAVIMWSGATTAIPNGWALCDGTNGAPDLRDRFIVGTGSTYAVGATGGEATHILAVAEMPSHTHVQNAHTHIQDSHNHVMSGVGWPLDGSGGPNDWGWEAGWTPNASPHVMNANVFGVTATNQNTTATNQNTGGDQPHENRPPYYALCFIMKLGY